MTKTDNDSKTKVRQSTKIIYHPEILEEFKKKLIEHFPEKILQEWAKQINKYY
ncbi:hypothetical protein ACH0BF_02075 [Pseudobacillus sp. 179-B 2D1 NHS]|uniref:hypothetical protein n=1 Tax=Pseudobacillus sp. 179-B 2D1 NHS TaxID=3374292 RepID=UPI00387A4077